MLFLLAVFPAHSQDLDTFTPSSALLDGQPALQLHHPTLSPAGTRAIGLTATMADDPLVEIYDNGFVSPIISRMVATWLSTSATLPWMRLSAAVPMYPLVVRNEELGAASGDASLLATVPLTPNIALIPEVRVPVGIWSQFTSAGGVSAGLTAALADHTENGGWTINVGGIRVPTSKVRTTSIGSVFRFGAGLHRDLGVTRLGAELTGQLALPEPSGHLSPVDLHGYATIGEDDGIQATAALGTGLVSGLGAPDYRILLGIRHQWRP